MHIISLLLKRIDHLVFIQILVMTDLLCITRMKIRYNCCRKRLNVPQIIIELISILNPVFYQVQQCVHCSHSNGTNELPILKLHSTGEKIINVLLSIPVIQVIHGIPHQSSKEPIMSEILQWRMTLYCSANELLLLCWILSNSSSVKRFLSSQSQQMQSHDYLLHTLFIIATEVFQAWLLFPPVVLAIILLLPLFDESVVIRVVGTRYYCHFSFSSQLKEIMKYIFLELRTRQRCRVQKRTIQFE